MARALLDRLPERFALAGFSLGGIVALEIVRLSPERVTRLALIDTTARPDSKTNWAARRNAVERAARVGSIVTCPISCGRSMSPVKRPRTTS